MPVKLRTYPQTSHKGMTMLEVLVIAFVLAVLALTLLPALAAAKRKAGKIHCTNNLMQIGLAFRIWEGDHSDCFPMSVSATNASTIEWVPPANATAIFQVMSNELSSPYILWCPSDRLCRPASEFGKRLTSSNVSYFVNMNAREDSPQGFLAGDDNFEIGGVPIESGLWEISSNTPIAWSAARHRFSGNLAMADGSVQGANNSGLNAWLQSTNATPMHLSIP